MGRFRIRDSSAVLLLPMAGVLFLAATSGSSQPIVIPAARSQMPLASRFLHLCMHIYIQIYIIKNNKTRSL